MNSKQTHDIQPLRMETSRAFLVAGIDEHYDGAGTAGIPAQWQKLAPYLGNVQQQVGAIAYGVCHHFGEGGAFDYLCGVEVSSSHDLPAGWVTLTMPADQTYAVFRHDEHVSLVRHTCHSIFSHWLPQSDYQSSDAPFFERYGPEFDGRTGQGGLEVWVPVSR